MKEEIVAALETALALINTELEFNGHPDNFDLEQLSYDIEDAIGDLNSIDEFEQFDDGDEE